MLIQITNWFSKAQAKIMPSREEQIDNLAKTTVKKLIKGEYLAKGLSHKELVDFHKAFGAEIKDKMEIRLEELYQEISEIEVHKEFI